MQRDLGGRRLLLVALLLFCAGLFTDPPWKRYTADRRVVIQAEAQHVAASLLRNGTFADPFELVSTGPTAHVAPVFPFVEYLLLKEFGMGAGGWLALECLPTIALSLQFAMLPYVSRLLGYTAWTGVLASMAGLVLRPPREETWEAHLAGLAGLLLTGALCRWGTRRTVASAALAGVLAGVVFLLQPVMSLVYLAWVAYQTRFRSVLHRNVWPLWTLPVIVCAPWIIRNQIAVGTYAIRDNLGIELNVSNNGCSPYGYRISHILGCFSDLHPNQNRDQALELQAMGESAYNRDRLRKALAWMFHNPIREATLAAERFWFFWFPSEQGWQGYLERPWRNCASSAVTIASIVGLCLSWKRRVKGVTLVTFWLALFPLIYYLVLFEPRYRYPILWITWLEAAYVVVLVTANWWRTPDKMEAAS